LPAIIRDDDRFLSGSGRSQSRHWNVRGPLPSGGHAIHSHYRIIMCMLLIAALAESARSMKEAVN
jgi:nucleoid-associated protein YejK